MFTEGHIIVKRTIKEWGWYHDPKMFTLFAHMMIDANYTDTEWEGRTIKRGQLVTSIALLAADTGLSVQEVRTCLKKLGGSGEVRSTSIGRRSIITLCNYDSYQNNQQGINKETTSGQQGSNTESTSSQHAISEEGNNATKQEGKTKTKKTSNDVKESPKRFVKPTVDEVRAYCQEQGYNIDAEYFVAYYESKGWLVGKSPMKSWKACIVTWVKKRQESGELFQSPTEPERVYPGGIKPQKV